MTFDMILMLAILLAAVLMFALEIFPVDKVSLLLLGALVVTGLVTPEQAVAGFGNPATVTVACMLALSFAIQRSGGLNFIAHRIVQLAKGSESRIVSAVMLAVGTLSAFINNTAAVALFLPLTISLARQQGLSPSRILMPMSFAAMMAGMCTLIGTSTNLLVYSIVRDSLNWEIGMFEFAEMGLIFFAVGAAYLLVVGRRLLPSRPAQSLTEDYRLRHFFTELIIREGSPLVGATPAETRFGELYDLEIIEILRGDRRMLPDAEDNRLRAGDILLVRGEPDRLVAIRDEKGIDLKALPLSDRDLEDDNIVLVEAFVSPTSRLVENTLKGIDFRRTFQATALAVRSHGRTIREKIGKVPLEFGDSLLILTTRDHVRVLDESPDFLVLEELDVSEPASRSGFIVASSIFVGIVVAATAGLFTILEAALVGLGLMVLTGCLRLNDLYSKISWQTIVMLGCLIPLGQAMENTQLAGVTAEVMVSWLSALGPVAILSGLYLLTSILTGIMSNNATAVLMVPIAIGMAAEMSVDAKPMVLAVMFAASSSFVTPVGYQTNLFIFGPGGYRFSDFLRVGGPLNLLFWGIATVFIPWFWPF